MSEAKFKMCPVCWGRASLNPNGRLRKHWTTDYWNVPCLYGRSEKEIAKLGHKPDDLVRHISSLAGSEKGVRTSWQESLK